MEITKSEPTHMAGTYTRTRMGIYTDGLILSPSIWNDLPPINQYVICATGTGMY